MSKYFGWESMMNEMVPTIFGVIGALCSLWLLFAGFLGKAPTPVARFLYIFAGVVGLICAGFGLVYEQYRGNLTANATWGLSHLGSFLRGMTLCAFGLTGVALYHAHLTKKRIGNDKTIHQEMDSQQTSGGDSSTRADAGLEPPQK